MHWIVQSNFFNPNAFDVLLETLEKFNLPYSLHKVIPYVGTLDPAPEIDSQNVICLGSYSMRHTAKAQGWTPGIFDLGPFDFPVQRAHWGDHMLNAQARVSPVREARVVGAAFVRPVQDSKAFSGRIFDARTFGEWQQQVCAADNDPRAALHADAVVQVCPVRQIYEEYRFWIVRGEIVCASLYKQGDRVFYSDEVPLAYFEFVEAMIAKWQPHEAFVIDVCSVPDDGDGWRGIKIVEINTLNSSAFYAANIQKLVAALDEAFGR